MATESQFDNVDSILTYFDDFSDPRSNTNRLHVLSDLLVIYIIAVIAGADGPRSIQGTRANVVGDAIRQSNCGSKSST